MRSLVSKLNKAGSYKDYEREHIGCSDIACLIMVGCTNNGIASEVLKFGEDGSYKAYIVTEQAIIGEHYEKMGSFSNWLKIYDDEGLSYEATGKEINVYRAGALGCIIEIIN